MAYTLFLSETEKACGVTLEAVAELLPKGLFSGGHFYLPANTPPLLGSATARAAFGEPAEFTHISRVTGYVGYTRRYAGMGG